MATDLDEALGTEKSSLKAAKKATKKPSKGVVLKGAAAKAKLRANGDRKTKVAGVDEPTDKPKRKLKGKPVKKSKKANKGVRHGEHTAKIEDAMSLIKRLKKGTTFTTRECAERWPDGPRGWAFREAAKRLVDDKIVKLKNVDRVNTITRL
jgi:hypothetical protein